MPSKKSAGKSVAVADKLINLVSGLGTVKDKTTGSAYSYVPMSREQMDAAYRSDWMVRKAIDIPGEDATRQGRVWQAEEDQVELLEAVEKNLNLMPKLMTGIQKGRLYGGCVLFIGIKGTSREGAAKELKPETVKKDGLEFLHVVAAPDISCDVIERNILSPYFGEPTFYNVTTTTGEQIKVHPSRVVRLLGKPMPSIDSQPTFAGFGDSVLNLIDNAIKNAASTADGIAALVQEAKVDIIKVPGFMDNVHKAEYRSKMLERYSLANISKSIVNTIILDGAEEWERVTAVFAGLTDIEQLMLLMVAGASDIPVTRFLGQSPGGLNATGESDLRNYYDSVASKQSSELTPALTRLDEVLIRSALGARPEEIYYEWRPLWQMNDDMKSQIWLRKAQVFQVDINAGLLNSEALAQARTNQLIEDGVYPGLQAAIDDAPEITMGEEKTAEMQAQFAAQGMGKVGPDGKPLPGQKGPPGRPGEEPPDPKEKVPTKDAKPRSLYVRRDVQNWQQIARWAKSQGFGTTVGADMHVTIAYSERPVDWMKVQEDWGQETNGNMTVAPGGARLVEGLGSKGAVVLLFNSSRLTWRHCSMIESGCSWEYGDDYQPHVTITYAKGDLDLSLVEPYRGPIELGPEIFEEIENGHADDLEES